MIDGEKFVGWYLQSCEEIWRDCNLKLWNNPHKWSVNYEIPLKVSYDFRNYKILF